MKCPHCNEFEYIAGEASFCEICGSNLDEAAEIKELSSNVPADVPPVSAFVSAGASLHAQQIAAGTVPGPNFSEEPEESDCKCLKVRFNKNIYLMSDTLSSLQIELTPLKSELKDVLILMAHSDNSGHKTFKQIPIQQHLMTNRPCVVSANFNPGNITGQVTLEFYVGCCLDNEVNYYMFSATQPIFDPHGSRDEFKQIIINQSFNAKDAADINFYGDVKRDLDSLPGKTANDMIAALHSKPASFRHQKLERIKRDPIIAKLIEDNSGIYPEITSKLLLKWNDFKIFLIADKEIKLGRDPGSCDLVVRKEGVPSDEKPNRTVSRVHGLVHYLEDHVDYVDKSSFGTWLNDEKIEGKTTLPPAARIEFGDIHWQLKLQYCHGAFGPMCSTCLRKQIKSLTFSRCDGDRECYLFVWQCCDLGHVITDLTGWKVFFRDKTFVISDPAGRRSLLVPGIPLECNGQKISVNFFMQQ